MRIDATHKSDAVGLDALSGTYRPAGKSSKVTEQAAVSPAAALDQAQQPYVSQVQQTPAVRASAVEEAKALLASGKLDTPEAARRAAGAILEQGF